MPDVGVLYFATDVRGCSAETLARFRPTSSAAVRQAAAANADQHLMAPGSVPAEWRELRTKIRVTCPDVYFVDVDDPATHTHLLGVLAAELHQLGVENLDVSTIRGPDRRVSGLSRCGPTCPGPK